MDADILCKTMHNVWAEITIINGKHLPDFDVIALDESFVCVQYVCNFHSPTYCVYLLPKIKNSIKFMTFFVRPTALPCRLLEGPMFQKNRPTVIIVSKGSENAPGFFWQWVKTTYILLQCTTILFTQYIWGNNGFYANCGLKVHTWSGSPLDRRGTQWFQWWAPSPGGCLAACTRSPVGLSGQCPTGS